MHERVAEYYAGRELPREQWRGIDDLAPQIARVEHLTAAGLHNAAAEVLGVIDGEYLLLWGYAQRIISLREPLEGNLSRPWFQMNQANLLGLCYYTIGRVRESITQYERGAAIAEAQHDWGSQGTFLGNLGTAYAALGAVQRAIDLYEQQLVIFREIGGRSGEGRILGNIGAEYAALGAVQRAIDLYEQALKIFREIDDRQGEGHVLGNLANCYFWLKNPDQADTLYEQAQQIHRDIGDASGQSDNLVEWGKVALAQHNPTLARERYAAALALDQPLTAGKAAWGCGVAALLGGEREQAIASWHDAAVRCGTMSAWAEYRYLAAAVGVALAVVDPDAAPEREAAALQALREILAERPLPLRAAECRRDLRYVAGAIGGGPGLALLDAALGLLEPIAAQMEGLGAGESGS